VVPEGVRTFRHHVAPVMPGRLLAGVVLVAALALVPASVGARTLTPSSKGLIAGSATVTSCGALTGVVTNFTISSNTVTAVLLTNIPTTCNGGSVSVTVTSAGTRLGGGGPVTVSSGGATVPISPAAPTGSVTHVRLAIVGP
jgi:hypothetical protein